MAGITISGGMIFTGGVAVGDGGGPGPGPGPGPSPASAGSLYSWGSAAFGQLGQNSIINKSSPTQVGADSTWLVMSSAYTTVAVKSDGTLWAWGEGDTGELGISVNGNRSSPVQIGSDTDWAFATQSNTGASTGAACFAIKSDGTLWAWGKNTDNTWLGLDTNTGNKSSPVQVGSSTWSTVASGLNWTIGIRTDGTLWGWGSPFNGSLPLDGAGGGYIGSPTAIGSDTNWSDVKGGPFWTGLALKTNGTLWSWGYNNWGQLGVNNLINASSPVQIGAGTNWASIGASGSSSFAITTAGELYSWGRNNSGQLGDGQRGTTLAKSSPAQVGALTNWARISTGDLGTKLAVKTDGTLWSWGVAPIGDDTAIARSSPIQIGSGTGWQNVATGTGVSMAIST